MSLKMVEEISSKAKNETMKLKDLQLRMAEEL